MPSGIAKGASSNADKSSSSGSGKSMTPADAARIQKISATNPEGQTHQSGFDSRAQAAAAKNQAK